MLKRRSPSDSLGKLGFLGGIEKLDRWADDLKAGLGQEVEEVA